MPHCCWQRLQSWGRSLEQPLADRGNSRGYSREASIGCGRKDSRGYSRGYSHWGWALGPQLGWALGRLVYWLRCAGACQVQAAGTAFLLPAAPHRDRGVPAPARRVPTRGPGWGGACAADKRKAGLGLLWIKCSCELEQEWCDLLRGVLLLGIGGYCCA